MPVKYTYRQRSWSASAGWTDWAPVQRDHVKRFVRFGKRYQRITAKELTTTIQLTLKSACKRGWSISTIEINREYSGVEYTKAYLSNLFTDRSDAFWGIETIPDHDDPECGQSTFVLTGYSGTCCTGYAMAIRSKLLPGHCRVVGFMVQDNPESAIDALADGHDFALVDNRFIVDPWLTAVESGTITTRLGEVIKVNGQVVFDLQSGDDAELIQRIYGSSANWSPVE